MNGREQEYIDWLASAAEQEDYQQWLLTIRLAEDTPMKAAQMIESKYLKQADIEGEMQVTVAKLQKVNIARDDEEAEYRWTIKFKEYEKAMVLNATNIKRAAKALGDDTETWIGGQLILYVDPDIEFGGNVVGGLRLRGLPHKGLPKRKTEADANKELAAIDKDDIPF